MGDLRTRPRRSVSVTGVSYDEGMFSVVENPPTEDWPPNNSSGIDEPSSGAPSSDTAHQVPAWLDCVEPGPTLAAILSSIEVDRCSGHDRVIVLRAHQRMASHYQAHVYRDIASVSDHLEAVDQGDIELANQGTVAEVRAALRLTRRAADTEVSFALDLKRRLPAVWAAFESGDLDVRRARTIVHGTAHLSQDAARSVASTILAAAPDLTTGQLAARLRKLCIDVDPDEAADLYEQAIDARRVVLDATDSGAATLLGLDLPADRAAAASARINQLARSLKTADEGRSLDQLRADVFLDLLEGTEEPSARTKGVVNIHVDLATLAELSEASGDLGGYGPVVADIARQVAAKQTSQQWRYSVTEPGGGEAVHIGTTGRRPTLPQRRQVEAQNLTCVFPGCRMPATNCDIDHRTDWAHGGRTSTENLDPLCRHDHVTKHNLGWTYGRLADGHHQWTTKLGHTYTTVAPP